jgi:hypothetical protein
VNEEKLPQQRSCGEFNAGEDLEKCRRKCYVESSQDTSLLHNAGCFILQQSPGINNQHILPLLLFTFCLLLFLLVKYCSVTWPSMNRNAYT